MLVHGGFWRARYGARAGGRRRARPRRRAAGRRGTSSTAGSAHGGGWPHTFDDVAAAIDALADSRRSARPRRGSWRSATRPAASSRCGRPRGRSRACALTGAVSQAGALDLHELSRLGSSDGVVRPAARRHAGRGARTATTRRRRRGGCRSASRCCSSTARATTTSPVHISREFAAAATAAGDACELVVIDDEGHYEHLEPGLAVLAGGDRVAAELTREHAAALDAADPLAGFRERFVIARPRADLPRRQLARPAAGRHARPAAGRGRGVGRPARVRLAGLDRRADAGRRRCSPAACSARAPGEVWSADSTTVNLFKLCSAALDAYGCAPGALVTDRDNFPTDRYVLEGLAAQRGLELRMIDADPLDGPQPDDLERSADGAVALVVLSHVAYRSGALADMRGAHRRRPPLRRARGLGPLPLGRRGAGRAARRAASSWRSAAPTSTSTPARARPRYLYVGRGAACRGCARRSGAGSASATSSRWSAPTTRCDGIGRFLAGTPPVLDLAAVEEGVRLTAEAGVERLREKSVALCELIVALHDAWLAPLGLRARLAARPGAPRLARRRCATRRRGRSAAR